MPVKRKKNFTPLTLIFDNESIPFLLGAFGKKVNKAGFIEDIKSGVEVKTKEAEKVRKEQFGGIVRGSEIFIKNDIDSLIRYLEYRDGKAE